MGPRPPSPRCDEPKMGRRPLPSPPLTISSCRLVKKLTGVARIALAASPVGVAVAERCGEGGWLPRCTPHANAQRLSVRRHDRRYWEIGREICAFAVRTPGWPPCLHAFCPSEVRPCVGRGAHGGTVDLPQLLLSLTPSSCPHLPHPQVFSVSHQGLRLRCGVAKKSPVSITSLSLRREEDG